MQIKKKSIVAAILGALCVSQFVGLGVFDKAVAASQEAQGVPDLNHPETFPQDPEDYKTPKSISLFKSGNGYKIGRPVPGGKATGVVPAGLEEFYGQKVEWGSCKDFDPEGSSAYRDKDFQCGYAILPLDYANPSGPTIAVAMMKLSAKKPEQKIGTLFMNPGGPGGSGLEQVYHRKGANEELNNKFDMVGFDPRGVGASLPAIRCESNALIDAERQGSDGLTAEQKNNLIKFKTEQCYQNTGKLVGVDGHAFIDSVGVVNVVRDMDVMRSIVGDEKLTYHGVSYGTAIGYNYLEMFPHNVRAMINDAVTNPFENNPALFGEYKEYTKNTPESRDLDQAVGFNATFERFMLTCAANDGWKSVTGSKVPCALGTSGDVKQMMNEYHKISQKTWGGTSYVAFPNDPKKRRMFSFSDMTKAVTNAMYSESKWEFLNQGLNDLKTKSDPSMLMSLADSQYARKSTGYGLLPAVFRTVKCVDGGTQPGYNEHPEQIIAGLREQYRVAPFTDPGLNPDGTQRGLEPTVDRCTYYSKQWTKPKGRVVAEAPKVLFIAGSYDSSTPYNNGVISAAATGGTLLTYATNSHGSFLKRHECVDVIGVRYLVDLRVPADQHGRQGVDTKDIYSNPIKGDECQIHDFQEATPQTDKGHENLTAQLPEFGKLVAPDTVELPEFGKLVAPETTEMPELNPDLIAAALKADDASRNRLEPTGLVQQKMDAFTYSGGVSVASDTVSSQNVNGANSTAQNQSAADSNSASVKEGALSAGDERKAEVQVLANTGLSLDIKVFIVLAFVVLSLAFMLLRRRNTRDNS